MESRKGLIKCKGTSKWQVKEDTEGSKWLAVPNEFKVLLDKEKHHQKPCVFHIEEDGKLVLDSVDNKSIAESEEVKAAVAEAEKEKEKRKQHQEWEKDKDNAIKEQSRKQDQKEYNLLDTYLPKDTQEILAVTMTNGYEIDNYALKLQKTANFPEYGKVAAIFKKDRKKGILQYTANFESIPFKDLNERHYQNATGQYVAERQLKSFKLSTATRLIIGIGGASVYEVGLTLHHVYGAPYIPASAIKGVTRSWMIQSQFDNDEGKALGDKCFCDLFGCPAEWKDENNKPWLSYYEKNKKNESDPGERQGNIIFFDAFPTQSPKIEEDVMNVHYPDYYRGEAPPTDFQSPNPIAFLTVAAGTPFHFMIAVKKSIENKDLANEELLNKAGTLLTSALTHHGIGAKTAVGYGYFKPNT